MTVGGKQRLVEEEEPIEAKGRSQAAYIIFLAGRGSGPPRLSKWEAGDPRSGAGRHGERGLISRGLP